jgi:hypothetical protein
VVEGVREHLIVIHLNQAAISGGLETGQSRVVSGRGSASGVTHGTGSSRTEGPSGGRDHSASRTCHGATGRLNRAFLKFWDGRYNVL